MWATGRHSEMVIIGSGGLEHPWWTDEDPQYDFGGDDGLAPDDWVMIAEALDDEATGATVKVTFTHELIVSAMRLIHMRKVAASPECKEACTIVYTSEDEEAFDRADFDSDTADEVLQVVAFGKIRYS